MTVTAPKFGLFSANTSPETSGDHVTATVTLAEELGLESLWAAEHIVIPAAYTTRYPYDRSGKLPDAETLDYPDPYVWLAYAAAVTTTIKLATGVTVLPLRHPLITAKQLATLDALSGGRLILGVGVGWLEEEFAALDVPFAGRGRRHDEYLEAIQKVWATDDASVDHSTVTFDGVISRPKPTNSHVPIVISGSSTAAARRAARIGDGFFPGSGNAEDLRAILAVLTEECITQNRDPADIEVTVHAGAGTPDQLSTTIEAILDAGAHRILLTNEPEAQLRALVETLHTRFGR